MIGVIYDLLSGIGRWGLPWWVGLIILALGMFLVIYCREESDNDDMGMCMLVNFIVTCIAGVVYRFYDYRTFARLLKNGDEILPEIATVLVLGGLAYVVFAFVRALIDGEDLYAFFFLLAVAMCYIGVFSMGYGAAVVLFIAPYIVMAAG